MRRRAQESIDMYTSEDAKEDLERATGKEHVVNEAGSVYVRRHDGLAGWLRISSDGRTALYRGTKIGVFEDRAEAVKALVSHEAYLKDRCYVDSDEYQDDVGRNYMIRLKCGAWVSPPTQGDEVASTAQNDTAVLDERIERIKTLTDDELLLMRRQGRWNELPADVRQKAVEHLRKINNYEQLKSLVLELMEEEPVTWPFMVMNRREIEENRKLGSPHPLRLVPCQFHMQGGMVVRNWLRTFLKDKELPSKNWDDYYVPIIEVAVLSVSDPPFMAITSNHWNRLLREKTKLVEQNRMVQMADAEAREDLMDRLSLHGKYRDPRFRLLRAAEYEELLSLEPGISEWVKDERQVSSQSLQNLERRRRARAESDNSDAQQDESSD